MAHWLQSNGVAAKAYHAGEESEFDRETLEQELLQNKVKVLVATVALGMGFDKPDLGFVIHFQRPGSVVAYYQQVGRAGRGVDRAYGILLCGCEDEDIHNDFIDSAFPRKEVMEQILATLAGSDGLSVNEILARVNVARPVAEKALKLLELDGAVGAERKNQKLCYFRTPKRWEPDFEQMEQVVTVRRSELTQMNAYVSHPACLMEFLARALDDPKPIRCGVCANCQGRGFSTFVSPELVTLAIAFLQSDDLILAPRKRWPTDFQPEDKTVLAPEHQNAVGRILSYYGDAGWGQWVRTGKYVHGQLSDELVKAAAELIANRWRPSPSPEWVTAIPSPRHPRLLPDFGERLARRLGLPFVSVLTCIREMPEQKTMANSALQARNVGAMLNITGRVRPGPVLLIDDIIDSGWTLRRQRRQLFQRGCVAHR